MIDFPIDTSRFHPPVRARKFAARAVKKQLRNVRCLCALRASGRHAGQQVRGVACALENRAGFRQS
jgi:hypothetical protein